MTDKLDSMFKQQESFMRLLQQRRGFTDFPVDLQSKSGQKFLKGIAYEAMGELFEAVQELRNSKSHRITDITQIDRDAYLEEIVDSLHYMFEIVIASGISSQELFDAFMKKGQVNVDRIMNDY